MADPDLVPLTARQTRAFTGAAIGSRPLVATVFRLAARVGLSIGFVVIALFPNVPRLAGQFSRALHPERLVDPFFPGSDEVVELLQRDMASLPPNALLSDRVKAVNTFVRKHIVYGRDWDLYGGNLHDWPKPEEVWRRRSDDCDGIAILNASLLQRLEIQAGLEYNAFHCWVRAWDSTDDPQSLPVSVGRAIDGPTGSRADGSVDWILLGRDLLRQRTWTEGLSFPLWRLLVALAAALAPWVSRRLGRGFILVIARAFGRPAIIARDAQLQAGSKSQAQGLLCKSAYGRRSRFTGPFLARILQCNTR